MKYCTQCGSQIAEGQAFCSNCGAPTANSQPVNEDPAFTGGNPDVQQINYDYQQPPFRQGGFKAPIMNRNVVTCIILSIVTCGIYGLYWYFCVINDLNTASETPDDASAGMVLLLSIVTCGIYGWIWLYKAGEKVDKIRQRNGETPSDSSIIYILLAVFGLAIVDYALIQTELNKVAAN